MPGQPQPTAAQALANHRPPMNPASPAFKLVTRAPSGRVPYPLILIEGEEKAGKTWECILLSKSDKVGQMYFIDLGEGCADEYGAIPGASYLIVEHDGRWNSILGA